jgi:predicted metal-dependent hydrolase
MDNQYHYHLILSKKRKKTISLHIKEDGKILVYAPCGTSKSEIEKFVLSKQSWVSEKLSEKEKAVKPAEKHFQPGEEFLYLGELYPLEIENGLHQGPPLKLSFGRFILSQNCIKGAKDFFIQWYKKEAKAKITERIDYYSYRLHLFPKGAKITSARYRWGSCSRDNRLSFSWRIIMAPLNVIDYVLIHELVHIREKNHSKSFWNYVESFIPDYKKHRLWLKENGHSLRL